MTPRDSASPPLRPGAVLAGAVLAVSSAAVLIRLAQERGVHPLAIGFWRTAGVALLLLPAARRMGARDARLTALAGLFLSLHFATWIAALQMTSVLRATVLVTLGPVWTGLLEWRLLRSPPPGRFWAGLAVALPGACLLGTGGGEGPGGGRASLLGDALALLGGVLSSAYLVTGRAVRQRVGVGAYGAAVCGVAALLLLPAALVSGARLVGFSGGAWLALAGLVLGPQLVGHNGFNYAVRWIPASVVSTAILLEPVGATVLAAAVLGERPGPRELAGGLLVLAGVILSSLAAFGGGDRPVTAASDAGSPTR